MYPRAADLTGPEVQGYSDRELLWIIKNGIRLERDARVWQGRVRRVLLELGPLHEDASGRRKPSPGEPRSHALSALPARVAFG
jgi:hypothetical protein